MRYRFFRIPTMGDTQSLSDELNRFLGEKRILKIVRAREHVARSNPNVGFRQPREQGRARWLVQDPVGDPPVGGTEVALAADDPSGDSVLVGTPDSGPERSLSAPWGAR